MSRHYFVVENLTDSPATDFEIDLLQTDVILIFVSCESDDLKPKQYKTLFFQPSQKVGRGLSPPFSLDVGQTNFPVVPEFCRELIDTFVTKLVTLRSLEIFFSL